MNPSLKKLYAELREVRQMEEAEVCRRYNADLKQDILDLIREEILSEEKELLSELPGEEQDDGIDYDLLCRIQGLSRYC